MEPPSSNLTDTSFLADPASEDPLAANPYNISQKRRGYGPEAALVVF